MRIIVPIWEDKISPVLDTASKLLILDTADDNSISRTETLFDEQDMSRRCFRICKLAADIVICGAVSRTFSERLKASGIHMIQGISGKTEDIIDAYFNGNLRQSRFLMPGCRNDQTDEKN
jgi:predicted Fe-Mo cluster-binding NifX family protein